MTEDENSRARRAAQVERRAAELRLLNRKEAQDAHSVGAQKRGMENLKKATEEAAARGIDAKPISWDYGG